MSVNEMLKRELSESGSDRLKCDLIKKYGYNFQNMEDVSFILKNIQSDSYKLDCIKYNTVESFTLSER